MKKAGINTELHIYASVGHGFGFREQSKSVRLVGWPARLHDWMADMTLLTSK